MGRAVLLMTNRPRMSRRAKLAIAAAFVVVGLIFFFGPSPVGLWRQSEQAACEKKCSELKKFARLVPAHPPTQVPQGKFEGPWTCECY
jgi:hypothetical protein